MNYLIRKRKLEDCKNIANIVTTSWNETYKGIVPDWFLDELKSNEELRAEKAIKEYDENKNNYIVLEVNREAVGFVWYGKSDDIEFDNCGEIIALYIISQYKGNGYGKKLMETAINELKNLGFDKIIIACLKGNPSNEFYKHMGGVHIKDGEYKRLKLPENIYLYKNI